MSWAWEEFFLIPLSLMIERCISVDVSCLSIYCWTILVFVGLAHLSLCQLWTCTMYILYILYVCSFAPTLVWHLVCWPYNVTLTLGPWDTPARCMGFCRQFFVAAILTFSSSTPYEGLFCLVFCFAPWREASSIHTVHLFTCLFFWSVFWPQHD